MASRQNYSSQVLNSQSTAISTNTTNAKEKSSHNKSEAKLKHGKVIHKFTSESYLRLICEKSPSTASSNDEKQFIDKSSSSSSGHIPMSSNTIINNMSKRKGTSFQITSVSVNSNAHHQQQGQRNSTDNNNGDDSCDDLDDSHTDDNISRITDYETPSISETFSGEDVFFTQPIAFGTAPVIPTSSQYGLAIVGPDLVGGDGSNLTDVHVSVTDAGINIMGPISGGNKQDVDHKNERFKVVKIESTEPFKRGRWMCMDYLDHTTLQDDGIDGKEGAEAAAAAAAATTKDDSNENASGSKILLGINNGDVEHVHSDNEELDHEVNRITSNNIDSIKLQQQQDMATHQNHNQPYHHHNPSQQQQHPQTLTSIPNFNDHSSNLINNNNQVAQSMPQGQIQMILTQEKLISHPQDGGAERNLATGNSATINNGAQVEQVVLNSSNVSSSTSQFQNSNISQQQSHFDQQHAQTMTQEMIHSMMYQEQQLQQQQQQQSYHQGATLPTNILMQNINTAGIGNVGDVNAHLFNPQSHASAPNIQQQLSSPISSIANALPTQQQQLTTIAAENIVIIGGEGAATGSEFDNNAKQQEKKPVNLFITHGAENVERSESESHQQQIAAASGSLGTNENINISSNNNNNNNSDNNNNITISNDGTQQQNASSTPSSSTQAGLSGTAMAEGGASEINESASNSVNSNNNNNNNGATVGGADEGQAISEDNESASGTSAVAIDNKIEQAMDLVKSHLMFAVREEVEVLKEKIAELMDRINQLEVENTILKANASQETLSQLTTAAVAVSPQTQQPATTQQQQSASPLVSLPTNNEKSSLPQQLISAPSQSQATMTQAAQASPNTQTQSTS